jgi:hypothetical protein
MRCLSMVDSLRLRGTEPPVLALLRPGCNRTDGLVPVQPTLPFPGAAGSGAWHGRRLAACVRVAVTAGSRDGPGGEGHRMFRSVLPGAPELVWSLF